MTTIDILMATYNGAEFIEQQIRSIQSQTWHEWNLYVHDDGSSDDTVTIVRSMAQCDKRIILLEDEKSMHSPALNFMYLLQYSTADFTIFSDQDDVWLENKLEVLYQRIVVEDQKLPIAVYGNAYIYNGLTNEISGKAILAPYGSLGETLFSNGGIQGCAIMMNRRLREICVDMPEYICMHDHLVTLAAFTFGRMLYVDKRLMLYRRHKDAVTDVTARNFEDKIRLFVKERKPVIDHNHFKAIESFYMHYAGKMSQDNSRIFLSFFKMIKQNFFLRVWTILRYPFCLYNSKLILISKMIVRPFVRFSR